MIGIDFTRGTVNYPWLIGFSRGNGSVFGLCDNLGPVAYGFDRPGGGGKYDSMKLEGGKQKCSGVDMLNSTVRRCNIMQI